MKRITMQMVAALAVLLAPAGCSAEWPFQWKPTEGVRQAQALVEDNVAAARPHADEAGQAHLVEAAAAARTVSSYVGAPAERLKTGDAGNAATLARAQADAARPVPGAGEVAKQLPGEVERTVLPWLDLASGLLLAVGAGGAGAAVLKYRSRAKAAAEAFAETVRGVENGKDALSAEDAKALDTELAKAQSAGAKAMVREVKEGTAA